jgi:hypothetical protein
MATTVQNPFDTQQASATNTDVTGSVQSMGSNVQPQTYTAQTSQVKAPTETVQGQVDSILSKDSPLMQRARTMATQQMSQRGLVNSSMAAGAGVAAMTDRALPMAQQDAQTYNQRALINQDAVNQQNQFNVGQTNDIYKFGKEIDSRYGLQSAQQKFEAAQRAMDRSFTTSERLGSQNFDLTKMSAQQRNQLEQMAKAQGYNLETMSAQQVNQLQQMAVQQQYAMTQLGSQQNFQARMAELEQSGLDFRQAREIASKEMLTQLEQFGVNNRFDKELALKSEMFNVEQYNLERRQIIDNQAQLERLGLQINANNQNIPTSFAANISNTTMMGVNAVMSDPTMSPEAKKTAISNLVKYANAQISWAEKFYNTAIPKLSTPI